PSFGSQAYWEQRFTTNTAPFDWLSAPNALDSFIEEALRNADDVSPQILHIGCGSSLLSQHLKSHVENAQQVHNVDYSTVVIDAERQHERDTLSAEEEMTDVDVLMRWSAVDLLDYASVLKTCHRHAYSIIVDKSTSDAVSCADDVLVPLPYVVTTKEDTARQVEVEPKEVPVYPLLVMAVNLALVTKPGARWISLSYTSDRYPFLEDSEEHVEQHGTADTGMPDPRLLWTVIGKHQIEAKQQGDGCGSGVTHRPKVYHCVYVLQRTCKPLFVQG
ncbi:hypothetical protein EJ07DRAFT_87970, partial [Lizonia empirigonia]